MSEEERISVDQAGMPIDRGNGDPISRPWREVGWHSLELLLGNAPTA